MACYPGSPLPDLAGIATDPSELEWISTLPFKYDQLDVEQVINTILHAARPGLLGIFRRSLTLKAKLAISGELKDVAFKLTTSRSDDGRRQLDIEPI